MTQTLYAHLNKRKKKERQKNNFSKYEIKIAQNLLIYCGKLQFKNTFIKLDLTEFEHLKLILINYVAILKLGI
jgi:hypothetical protein